MLNKLSNKEIIKGYINDYTKIKDAFKAVLHADGFRWNKDWDNQNLFGREGVWFSPISGLSIRIRWGVSNPCAIVYVEKEFKKKIIQFFDYYEIVNGMAPPSTDFHLLNKGELSEKSEK